MRARRYSLRRFYRIYAVGSVLIAQLMCTQMLCAQVSPDRGPQEQSRPARTSQAQQSSRGPGSASNMIGAENPLIGGIPTGEATSDEIPLTLTDTLERGLKYNFGLTQGALDTR